MVFQKSIQWRTSVVCDSYHKTSTQHKRCYTFDKRRNLIDLTPLSAWDSKYEIAY